VFGQKKDGVESNLMEWSGVKSLLVIQSSYI